MSWKILDCTLRDGGYYTNWDFSQELVKSYTTTVSQLPVAYLEVGYRNLPHPDYFGEFFYLPESSLAQFSQAAEAGLKLAIMMDEKKYTPQEVPSLLKRCQGSVHLVRMTVRPSKIDEGIALAKAVKSLGFEVALNMMYLSKMREDLSSLLKFKDHGDSIDYLYLVDSYGACFPAQIKAAFEFAKANLPMKIGFHGHDNIGLAFVNTLTALEAGADIVDATILGMGRGAGNLRTELITAYLSKSENKPVDLSSLADLLEHFQVMKDEHRWGPELPYIISGFANLPQKDVMEWLGKKRFSTSTVVETLQGSQEDTPLSQPYPSLTAEIERLGLNDASACIIVGGGSSAADHASAVAKFAQNTHSPIIHSSFRNAASYSQLDAQQILCLPGREAEKLAGTAIPLLQSQFMAYVISATGYKSSSVPAELSNQTFETVPIARTSDSSPMSLVEQDSPLGLALSVAQASTVQKIFLVGFDGYPDGSDIQKELAQEIQELLDAFQGTSPGIEIYSLTPTKYAVHQQSVYAMLC